MLPVDTKQGVEELFHKWRSAMKLRCLKINVTKTKLLVSDKENLLAVPTG